MREPIDFNDIELGDVLEHVRETYNGKVGEYVTTVTGYHMTAEIAKRIAYNQQADLLFTEDNRLIRNPAHIDRWELLHGQWYVLERIRWRHTEDTEGWAA